MKRAKYIVVEDDFLQEEPLVLEDVGPWDVYPTITNDAEAVVRDLVAEGRLPEGRRLLYFDSEGNRDEILVEGGRFAGFKPAREEAPPLRPKKIVPRAWTPPTGAEIARALREKEEESLPDSPESE